MPEGSATAVLQRFAAISARIDALETQLFSSPLQQLACRQAAIDERLRALESKLGMPSLSAKHIRGMPRRAAAPEAPAGESAMYKRMHAELIARGVTDFTLVRVPGPYYEKALEFRAERVGAASTGHLCKSVVMVNSNAPAHVVDCSNPKLSKYYMVLVQYTTSINTPKLQAAMLQLANQVEKVPKVRVNLRLADEDLSCEMTGFGHNAVTPICSAAKIPIVMSHEIAALQGHFFLGAGEIDLKVGMKAADFCEAFADVPVYVVDFTGESAERDDD